MIYLLIIPALVIPLVDRLKVVDIRGITQDIEPQETMTIAMMPSEFVGAATAMMRLADRRAGASG